MTQVWSSTNSNMQVNLKVNLNLARFRVISLDTYLKQ